MIGALNRRRRCRETAARLCAAVSARARDPIFYLDYGVADTIDGRFDVLVLHAWLVLDWLREAGDEALAQSFVDALFVRFDEALREQGAGDMGMSRRIRKMASAFYGRLRAYSESRSDEALGTAILRNVYRGSASRVEQAALLAKYVAGARKEIMPSRLDRGELEFGPTLAP
ncbi:MAG TPA: ubiquinol-cytochrome C chaperone family protein [Rhizomicrobium sp.]|jgi:cytochrome b pre-mRNA-processing protein 3|nr:ubiquinol-cytochrome C chaperone family protein [Rhizomicrobium sp.]